MFNKNVRFKREEVLVSPIALATCIGDYSMLEALLGYLTNVNVDRGLYARALNQPIMGKAKSVVRRTSPL